jgi:predicted aspartyl protease
MGVFVIGTITGSMGKSRQATWRVDTGADNSLMPTKVAQSLGLRQTGNVVVTTANGTKYMPIFAATLTLGDNEPFQTTVIGVNENLFALGMQEIKRVGLVVDIGGTASVGGVPASIN